MKRRSNVQHIGSVTQLSLFGSHDHDMAPSPSIQEVLKRLEETNVYDESKEAWERRRVAEMAKRLDWPQFRLEPLRRWAGVTISEGEESWRAFLEVALDGVGLVMLALHKRLDPLTHESIDEATGLQRHPVEVLSQREEQVRTCMMQLAEIQEWPRVSWWDADRTRVIGPGEEIWRKYQVYGCYGCVIGAVTALKRRLEGVPEQVRPTSYQPSHHDDEEEDW
jgi:hypothetical protein